MSKERKTAIKTLLKKMDKLSDNQWALQELNFDEAQATMAARDPSGPTDQARQRSKIIDMAEKRYQKFKIQLKTLMKAQDKEDAKKTGERADKFKEEQQKKKLKLEQKEKSLKEQKSKNKVKLKNLSLRGRGGGGSIQMPQEYSKRSLLKKPMS